MPKHISRTQRIIAYMIEHGYKEIPSTTKRYRTFMVSIKEDHRTYYVGKAGGVRCSKTGTIGGSYSVTDIFMKYVALWELKQQREHENEVQGSAAL